MSGVTFLEQDIKRRRWHLLRNLNVEVWRMGPPSILGVISCRVSEPSSMLWANCSTRGSIPLYSGSNDG